jgi:hypothetical protein
MFQCFCVPEGFSKPLNHCIRMGGREISRGRNNRRDGLMMPGLASVSLTVTDLRRNVATKITRSARPAARQKKRFETSVKGFAAGVEVWECGRGEVCSFTTQTTRQAKLLIENVPRRLGKFPPRESRSAA